VLSKLKNSTKTVGTKQTVKAMQKGIAEVVFIAKDADKKIIERVVELCKNYAVEIFYADNMKQLGKSCNIKVGAAIAAIVKSKN